MNIRVILSIIGAVIVFGIIFDGLWRKKRSQTIQHKLNRGETRLPTTAEPEFELKIEPKVELAPDQLAPDQLAPDQIVEPVPTSESEVQPLEASQHIIDMNSVDDAPEVEQVVDDFIVLTIMAKPGQSFSGFSLLQALLKMGLTHGEMNIFHRHRDLDNKSPVYFSVASVTKPGYFDIQNMNICITKGLSLFISVPDVADASDVFEIMLATAQQLAKKLNGIVCDRQREPLSDEALAACRSRAKISGNLQPLWNAQVENDSIV